MTMNQVTKIEIVRTSTDRSVRLTFQRHDDGLIGGPNSRQHVELSIVELEALQQLIFAFDDTKSWDQVVLPIQEPTR